MTVSGLAIDDDVFRVLSRTVQTAKGPRVLQIGTTQNDVAESTEVLVGILAIAVLLAVALLAVVVWWLVGRTLKPVETSARRWPRQAPRTFTDGSRCHE